MARPAVIARPTTASVAQAVRITAERAKAGSRQRFVKMIAPRAQSVRKTAVSRASAG